jgi:hypothetical protein
MTLIKLRLGDCIELYNEKCGIPDLTVWDISGVNSEKEFFEPSKQAGADTSGYKVVPPNYFACNLMHVGRDRVLPIALNHTEKSKIVSPAYTIFKIKDGTPLLKEFFFIMLKSTERDRYFWFHTDSSVRDGMTWDDFCDLIVDIPSIEIQKKYVAVYSSMLENQRSYATGLEDLKTLCTAYIEKLRRNGNLRAIGEFIQPYNEKNTDGALTLEQGINIEKQFITPQRENANLTGRKIVRKGMFAYCTQLNNENVAIAYRTGEDCVVSGVYDVFQIIKPEELLPEYLMLWLIRPEFGRFVYWASEGSAYEFLNYDNLANYKIPVPDISIQRAIGNIYLAYVERCSINDRLKAQIKDLCPILIKGSIEEARA